MRIILNESQLSEIIYYITESNSNKLNVLFVGDSLSAGPGWTWNYLLDKSHPNWNVNHLTKGGTRTSWMLDNLKAELSKKKYDIVFIYGGTNDMFSLVSIPQALSNIQNMVNLVNQQGGKAYVLKGYDAQSVISKDKLKPTKYCNKECMLNGRKRLIEFQNDLGSISKAIVIPTIVGDDSWTSDGLHPNASKHQLIKSHVENYLSKTPTSGSDSILSKTSLKKEDISLIHKFLQLLGFSNPEWGISNIVTPEFQAAVNNFRFSYGLDVPGEFGDYELDLLKSLLVKNNFDSSDLEKVKLEKTKSVESIMGATSKLIGSKFEDFAVKQHGNKFLEEVEKIGSRVGLDYKIILATMFFESKMNPSAQNPSSRATGLIQFMPSTAKSLGTSVDSLKNMSAIEQLKYVEEFYKKHKNLIPKITSPEEAYLLVFYPAAVGKSEDYILGNTPKTQELIAAQNKPFDSNNDKKITKGEILNFIRKKWNV